MTCKEIEGVARKCGFQVIDLDKIPELKNKRRADCILVREDKKVFVIVDTTGYAKRYKIDQIESTYNLIRNIEIEIFTRLREFKPYIIIYGRKGVDTQTVRILENLKISSYVAGSKEDFEVKLCRKIN